MTPRSILIWAIFISLAGSGAYVVARSVEGDDPGSAIQELYSDAVTSSYGVAADPVPAASEAPLVEEARVPFPPRNVTPPGIYTGPVRRYDPPEGETSDEQPPMATRSFPRVVVEEAGLLSAGDTRIRLGGVAAPELDATCTDANGEEWPCGRRAMAALRLLVRNRAVDCEISEERTDELVGRCRVGDRDIVLWLVEQGWAEPAESGHYEAEFEAARSEQRGMFAGSRTAAPPVSIPISTSAAD